MTLQDAYRAHYTALLKLEGELCKSQEGNPNASAFMAEFNNCTAMRDNALQQAQDAYHAALVELHRDVHAATESGSKVEKLGARVSLHECEKALRAVDAAMADGSSSEALNTLYVVYTEHAESPAFANRLSKPEVFRGYEDAKSYAEKLSIQRPRDCIGLDSVWIGTPYWHDYYASYYVNGERESVRGGGDRTIGIKQASKEKHEQKEKQPLTLGGVVYIILCVALLVTGFFVLATALSAYAGPMSM